MPQTQIACPRCRQMIAANIEQLFDVTQDPQSKQRLLGGVSNMARCPHCGYQGRLATPIVYHDNDKELLLTFFPPELNVPLNEQERVIGPLIKQVMDRLPAEKRKGYLLKPTPNLSYESMVKLILEKDGVTPEMLKEQQDRVAVIERLIQASSSDVRSEILKQNANMIDEQFFALFSRLAQSASGSGQANIAQAMLDIQKQLLVETEYGRELQKTRGITPEALQAQQDRVTVIEKLLQVTSNDARSEIIKQNISLFDEQFFALFSRLAQNAAGSGQEQMARAMVEIQKQLLDETEFGRQLRDTVAEMEAAQKTLQEAGQGLTLEKLVDIVLQSPSDARLKAYASLVRGGMDYQFFQLLTERIEKASGDEKAKFESIREKLLSFTNEMDKQAEARYKQAQELVEEILAQEDVEKAVQESLPEITQDVVDVASQMLRQASEKSDYARMGKLQKMIEILRQASTPPEVEFIEHLLDAPDNATLEKMLADNKDMLNDQFMQSLIGLVAQVDEASAQGNPEAKALADKLSNVYKTALKFSMKQNMG
jgi:hypothetical protein